MGQIPPLPPKPGSGIYTDRNGGQAQRTEPIKINWRLVVMLAGVIITLAAGSILLIDAMWIDSGNDDLFYHVTCHDDGRKIFDETLQLKRGFAEGVFYARPGSDLEIRVPIEKCILIEVERPSHFSEYGR